VQAQRGEPGDVLQPEAPQPRAAGGGEQATEVALVGAGRLDPRVAQQEVLERAEGAGAGDGDGEVGVPQAQAHRLGSRRGRQLVGELPLSWIDCLRPHHRVPRVPRRHGGDGKREAPDHAALAEEQPRGDVIRGDVGGVAVPEQIPPAGCHVAAEVPVPWSGVDES
jgi:hypothetical protein